MMTKAGHRALVGCFEAFLDGPHHLCMLLRRENVQTKVFSLIPLPKENEGELFTSEAGAAIICTAMGPKNGIRAAEMI